MRPVLHIPDWIPSALAAVAFVGFAAVFALEISSYRRDVIVWAERDLQSRANLAAANLEEPLRTQDFRWIHAFAQACAAKGVRLTITGLGGGHFFDSARADEANVPSFACRARSGEYVVSVSVPQHRVLLPFYRALFGFGLAALVGMAGVLLFFLVTYRQHVRIRELARLERFRREFIADVSHEIKTPLTGILGAADMLGDAALPPAAQARLVDMVKGSARRLNGLVQGILALARLEREGDIVHPVPTDLAALVNETVDTLRTQAETKQMVLTIRGAEQPLFRSVDPQLVGQALTNLIVNAIRYSGSPDVLVSLASTDREVTIAVEDHGIGIPAEHRARIFERFYRVDVAREGSTGGSGLGLAIVRQIARLHGGDVRLESATPSGCRFVLEILKS